MLFNEASAFVNSLPIKARQKIVYNLLKLEQGVMDKDIFKKLDSTDIWELRTLFNGMCYRLFAFWDTENEALVTATHGIVKKAQKNSGKRDGKSRRNDEKPVTTATLDLGTAGKVALW